MKKNFFIICMMALAVTACRKEYQHLQCEK